MRWVAMMVNLVYTIHILKLRYNDIASKKEKRKAEAEFVSVGLIGFFRLRVASVVIFGYHEIVCVNHTHLSHPSSANQ